MPDKDTSSHTGYSQEDEYFKRQELEFLKKKRSELDAQRQQASAQNPAGIHWMKCPKCGGDMQEQQIENVTIDKCTQCQGIYFDKGELELLTAARSGGLFKKLFG